MTEEEKDILQDKIIREEANYFESNQHKALLAEDDDYKMSFNLKEGIARAAAKDFIQKALETPIVPIQDEGDGSGIAAAKPVASYAPSVNSTLNSRVWMGIAASILVAAVTTFMLADFRSANEFVTAHLESGYQSDYSFRDNQLSRGSVSNWILAFEEENYDLVADELDWISVASSDSLKEEAVKLRQILLRYREEYQAILNSYSSTPGYGSLNSEKLNLLKTRIDSIENQILATEGKLSEIQAVQPSLVDARFALGISKLYSPSPKRDFGVPELNWLSNQSSAIDSAGLDADEVNWYLALAHYKEGNCQDARSTLLFITEGDSEYKRDAKKLSRKMTKECALN